MTTERNPNVEVDVVSGDWVYKIDYLLDVAKPPLLPKQWNAPPASVEQRLRLLERQNQQLLTSVSLMASIMKELIERPGLTAEDVSKLLEFTGEDKTTLDELLAGNIINRISALE